MHNNKLPLACSQPSAVNSLAMEEPIQAVPLEIVIEPKPVRKKRDRNFNYEALKALVVMFGPREAARQAGLKEDTVLKMASRKGWKKAGLPNKHDPTKLKRHLVKFEPNPPGSSICHQSPANALSQALTRFKQQSSVELARYSARAAKALNKHPKPLEVTRKAVDISDVHKTLWPAENQNQNILQIGFLIQGK